MCGIFGYIGKERSVTDLIEGLKRLEYRGYDSAGCCFFAGKNGVMLLKEVGKIQNLEAKLPDIKTSLFSSHTRWATHGQPTRLNAHPHSDCKKEIFVVHNGIIENYKELKNILLKKGHTFQSDTDTEVLPDRKSVV